MLWRGLVWGQPGRLPSPGTGRGDLEVHLQVFLPPIETLSSKGSPVLFSSDASLKDPKGLRVAPISLRMLASV